MLCPSNYIVFFFFMATSTTKISTLSLHDALPISTGENEPARVRSALDQLGADRIASVLLEGGPHLAGAFLDADRKSTRLNSSHPSISYAVFCLKKKKDHK